MTLNQQLEEHKMQVSSKISSEARAIMQRATESLKNQNLEARALQVGDTIPEFTLKNAVGETISSSDLLRHNSLVLNFYRGAWCPYCNLELRGYQKILPQIQSHSAKLVAISPELPDESLSLIEKHSLQYEILSDVDNEVARNFGLVFQLDVDLIKVYQSWGIDLPKAQGNARWELPVPATYVIGDMGTVLLSHVNVDYTKRLEPSKVLELLERGY